MKPTKLIPLASIIHFLFSVGGELECLFVYIYIYVAVDAVISTSINFGIKIMLDDFDCNWLG